MKSNSKEKGFSLIELLIVVAIILIIAAIAIPNLLRSKMAANEASAVASLRTYNTSIVAYETTYATAPTTNLSTLGPSTTPSSTAADLVDNLLGIAAPIKSGYAFTYKAGAAACEWQRLDVHDYRQPDHSKRDRSADLLHGPEWCDSPENGWHHRSRHRHSDRRLVPGSSSLGGERQTPFSPIYFSSRHSDRGPGMKLSTAREIHEGEDCNASDRPGDLACPRLNTPLIDFRIRLTSGEFSAWSVRAEVCITRPLVVKNPTMAISRPRETGFSASGPESPREAESLAILPAETKSGK